MGGKKPKGSTLGNFTPKRMATTMGITMETKLIILLNFFSFKAIASIILSIIF
jgi:hypothetical protein